MGKNKLQIFYLLTGFSSLLLFVWTGHYLSAEYPDKQDMDTGLRAMVRSRHIFLLLVSLLTIGLGLYIRPAKRAVYRWVQGLSTSLLLTAQGLFVWAFFYEVSPQFIPETPVLHGATYVLLASLVLHSLVLFDRE